MMRIRAGYSTREKRLARGRCPLHNTPLSIIKQEASPDGVLLGRCSCKECSVLAWVAPYPERNALLDPWAYLCDKNAPDVGEENRSCLTELVLGALQSGARLWGPGSNALWDSRLLPASR